MSWRKLIPRLLLLLAVGLVGGGYALYRHCTCPTAVRAEVLAALSQRLPGAAVQLDSAELRLFGGIELTNLRVTRKDASDPLPIAEVPHVILRHDKEEMGKGKVVIRKIEMRAPRLTLVRHRDRSWNIAGIVDQTPSEHPLPVLEISDGTLTLIDEAAGGNRLEVHGVDLKAMPGESGRYRLHANGQTDIAGRVIVEGAILPATAELRLSAHIPEAPIGPPLLAALSPYLSCCRDPSIEVQGNAAVELELAYLPGATTEWSHHAKLTLNRGRIRHDRLPLPVENVSASAHWDGTRLVLERLSGDSLGAKVHADGELSGMSPQDDFTLNIRAEKLRITRDLFAKLPPQMALVGADFSPEGTLSLKSVVRQAAGKFTSNYTATLEGVSILYKEFPYPLSGVTGTLEYSDGGEHPVVAVSMAGVANRRPVKLTGKVFGHGLRPNVEARPGIHLDITGEGLPIHEELIAALPEAPERVARQFKPGGIVDVRAELRRKPGTEAVPRFVMENRYVVHFRNAHMCYEKFPYPVEDVQGSLELGPGGWSFTGFRGRHKGGLFTGSANSAPGPHGDHIIVNVKAVDALLDHEMEAALVSPRMSRVYVLFRPQGRVDFTAKVDTIGKAQPELDLILTARNCAMKPSCFPYQLTHVQGTFHFVKDRVTLREFRAQHEKTLITLGRSGDGGFVDIRPGGGYLVTLRQLHAEPLAVDAELLSALPTLVRQAFSTLQPDRPVRIITDMTIDDPGQGAKVRYDWNGHVAFADTTVQCGFPLQHVTGLIALWGKHDGKDLQADGNLRLEQMTVGKQVFRDVRSELKMTQDTLVFRGLIASLHGGQLYGPIRVEFGSEPTYRVDLQASNVDLEAFARETLGRSGQVKGRAKARLELRGRGGDLSTLRGTGSLRIEEGRLYDLPLILDLLSTLSGHLPKGSAFQEANADFAIEGDRMRISQLQLIGDALTLEGQGEMRVTGSGVKLEMYGLLWGRTIPLLPAIIDQIPSWLSKRLMKIIVEGDLAKVNAKLEPVPVIVEPVKALLKTVSGRQDMEQPGMRRP